MWYAFGVDPTALQEWPLALIGAVLIAQFALALVKQLKPAPTPPPAESSREIADLAKSIHDLALAIARLDGARDTAERQLDSIERLVTDTHGHVERIEAIVARRDER